MKITIICHYYPPEIGAPQARLSEMAKSWVALGNEVSVITCFPNHPTGKIHKNYEQAYKKRFLKEIIDGVIVNRCWVYATENKGFVKKLLGHLSFMVTSVFQAGKAVKHSDIIIVSSPTFFSVISAWFLALKYRKPYIFEVRDLWPAIFVELGVLKNKAIIWMLEQIELFLYKRAAAVVPVTKRFANCIIERGISYKKVSVITNGVDLEKFLPQQKNISLLKELGIREKSFIVLYIGAHGISHALCRIVDAAEYLADKKNILFLFVGEGAEKAKVKQYAEQKRLSNLSFLPGQSKERVIQFYSIMDVGLVPLRNIPLFETFIPSKMFEIMGMEKPIVASVKGEAEQILNDSGAAYVTEPENSKGIADCILRLYKNDKLRNEMAKNGRKFVMEHYNRSELAKTYLSVIDAIISKRK